MDPRHSTRCVNGVIYWHLAAAFGAQSLLAWKNGKRRPIVVAILVGLGGVETADYMRDYFTHYGDRSALAFTYHFVRTLEEALTIREPGEPLLLDQSAFDLPLDDRFRPYYYPHLLCLARVPPPDYQNHGFEGAGIEIYTPRARVTGGLLIRRNGIPAYFPPEAYVAPPRPLPEDAQLLYRLAETDVVDFELYRLPKR